MRILLIASLVVLSSACGNERIQNDTAAADPDIGSYELSAEETGFFGYWQRRNVNDAHIGMFLTIDRKALLHTTVCSKGGVKIRATAASKIDWVESDRILVKKDSYADTRAKDVDLICYSEVTKGEYELELKSGDELDIRVGGQQLMGFDRTTRETVTD